MTLVMNEKKIGEFKSLISRFTIPVELLDDIIYCQRSLRQYMRVHQILVNRLPDRIKTKQIDEIEHEICDIGREQNALIARLRSTLELYYTIAIKKENVEIDREIGNAYVSRILSHNIENGNSSIIPKTIKKRLSEGQLFTYYGLHDLKRKHDVKTDTKTAIANSNLKQESLLKPKSERFALQKVSKNSYPYAKHVKIENDNTIVAVQSPSINSSRLNLLQALNKARNQSLHNTKPPLAPPSTADTKETIEISSSQSSSSDDSLDIPLDSPFYSEDETEISQEMFLRKFGLYTVEYSHYLKTKRSQRRRRNVQSNEKSDFHYGKLDMFEKMNKKKKTYLHSPPVTRGPKRRRIDKDNEGTSLKSSSTDRSTSSSPDQKFVCVECSKPDNLNKCETCMIYYHVKCHKLAPKIIARKVCPNCYLKLKEAKEARTAKEARISRESRDSKNEKDTKENNGKTSKSMKDETDLGVAPLDNDN